MKIENNKKVTLKTNKVKVLATAKGYNYVAVGYYNGEVQLVTVEDNKINIIKSVKVTNGEPVRALCISVTNNIILAGCDRGNVTVLDSESLDILRVIDAHSEIIRDIAISEKANCFITSADDCSVKLFNLDNYTCKQLYSDFKHYVMGVSFDPEDSSIFYACSLDGKVRKYSTFHNKRLETFYQNSQEGKSSKNKTINNVFKNISKKKITTNFRAFNNLSGLNSIAFISKDCFGTVNDDGYLCLYDKKRKSIIYTKSLFSKEGNKIKKIGDDAFGACSNDGTCCIIEGSDKVIGEISSNYKIWDFCAFQNKILLGTCEELILVSIYKEKEITKMASDRIFTLKSSVFNMKKVDELVEKEIGTISEEVIDFHPSVNGKMLGVILPSSVCIYSILGLRKKLEIKNARDVKFCKDGGFCIIGGDSSIVKYDSTFNVTESFKLSQNIKKIFSIEGNCLLVGCKDDETLLVKDGEVLFSYEKAEKGCVISSDNSDCPYVMLFNSNNSNRLFLGKTEISVDFTDSLIVSYVIHNSILYINLKSSTFYVLFRKNECLTYHLKHVEGNLLGGFEDNIYYSVNGKISSFMIEPEFMEWQKCMLVGNHQDVKDSFRSKAIGFYESVGMYEEALEICQNKNQKFEILLKLFKFDQAIEFADSPAKYNKIGEALFEKYKSTKNKLFLIKASDCFYNARNYNSLLVTDVFSEKKYLGEIGEKSVIAGDLNLALMAFYKNGDFKRCSELLKDTIYSKLFSKYYLDEE